MNDEDNEDITMQLHSMSLVSKIFSHHSYQRDGNNKVCIKIANLTHIYAQESAVIRRHVDLFVT